MRLAFCNATRRWGGVKTWTVEFAAALQERGHTVSIYGKDKTFLERAKSKGLETTEINFGFDYNPSTIGLFCREFSHKRMDAVLVNVGKDLRTAGFAARLLQIPLIQRIGLPGDMRNSLKVRLTHHLLRPHYLCPCRFIRDGLLGNLPFLHEEETSVIYSAKTPLAAPPGHCGTPLRILSSSQVNINKGHAELAHTLSLLRQEGFDFHWHIAGTGRQLDKLKELCARLGLGGSVTLHGFVQDLSSLLRSCDVFALSSYTEGLPNTLLEAQAYGLVPVARDVGGVRECWPVGLPYVPAPYTGGEREKDWYAAETTPFPAELPLYASMRKVLSAASQEIRKWKSLAWEHCARHFSLQTQAEKLEDFFLRRIQSR